MNLNALQAQMQRQAIFELVIALIALLISLGLVYWITKAAIRDGIKESGLVEALEKSVRAPHIEEKTSLPEMRADR